MKWPLSQVLYAVREYACTATDVIARRTRLGFLNVQAADEALPRIVQIMGKELDWSEEKKTVFYNTFPTNLGKLLRLMDCVSLCDNLPSPGNPSYIML